MAPDTVSFSSNDTVSISSDDSAPGADVDEGASAANEMGVAILILDFQNEVRTSRLCLGISLSLDSHSGFQLSTPSNNSSFRQVESCTMMSRM